MLLGRVPSGFIKSHDGNFGDGERAMAKIKILQEGQSYTFRSYFELPYEADDILAEFNYSLIKSRLSLPQTTKQLDRLPELKQRIEDVLPFISLSNETARRETLVSPIMLEVVRYCQCKMRIEYPYSQQITQDINLFKVPDDLDSLVRVLLGILEGE
jgi:hypothetical protein